MDRGRVTLLLFLFLAPFGGLQARLIQMQVSDPEAFIGDRSRRSHLEVVQPPRGKVLDVHGETIAENRRSFDCYLVLEEHDRDPDALRTLLGIPREEFDRKVEEIYRKIERVIQRRPRKEWRALYRRERRTPYLLKRDIDFEHAMAIETAPDLYAGGVVRKSLKRIYPHGQAGCHLVGYLGLPDGPEFDRLRDGGYYTEGFEEVVDGDDVTRLFRTGTFHDELIGKAGLERRYNDDLRGRHGLAVLERAPGTSDKTLIVLKPAEPGRDLELTVDIRIQAEAERILSGLPYHAAAVVLAPDTGAVVALASNRLFDPNAFTPPRKEGDSARVTAALNDTAGKPLMSRAFQQQYQLGSIFKVVTSIAGIEEGHVTPEELLPCRGQFMPGVSFFNCWIWNNYRGQHGELHVAQALERSCNCYYYEVARRTGLIWIAKWAFKTGYGRKTGLDLPGEAEGAVPRQNQWRNDALSLAIGQHNLMVSPLQAAVMMAVVANGGYRVTPHLNRRLAPEPKPTGIAPTTIEAVQHGLIDVVNGSQGTARSAGLGEYKVAGKTSTAQAGKRGNHAWFAGYAPYDDPRYVVVVFVEYGGHGGETAAPPAREILRALFEKRGE